MKPVRIAALLLTLLTLLSACSQPTAKETAGPALTWTGTALAGAKFYRRTMDGVTVHYAAPTLPDQAEVLATAADAYLRSQRRDTWLAADQQVNLWILPAKTPWPADAPPVPPHRSLRAAGPRNIIVPETVIDAPVMGQPGLQLQDIYPRLARAGLAEAVAVAVTQQAGSPAYSVAWIHEGMGTILTGNYGPFPARLWVMLGQSGGKPSVLMERVTHPHDNFDLDYWQAAGALAALAWDRWGINWPMAWSGREAEATPEAILAWATGQADQQAALTLWQKRIGSISIFQVNDQFQTLAEFSPIRVEAPLTALPKGPGPHDNYSPHAYDIRASYDPGTRTVTGTEILTWRNGEGIPVESLYFHLWPNDELFARQDGGMSIASVTVDGQAVPFKAENLDLVVPLGKAVAPGDSVRVEIAFATRVPTAARRAFRAGPDGLLYLSHWYPTLAVLDDRGWNLTSFPTMSEPYTESAAYHVTLEVDAGTVLGATGRQLERREQGNRWTYVYEAPQAKGWVAAGGPDLTEEVRKAGPVTIRVLEPSGTWGKKIADAAEQTLALFAERFGPYPGEELVVMPTFAPVKAPGVVFLSSDQQDDVFRPSLYHGIAHQWFYGSVGSDPLYELWLDESLAFYGELMAGQALGGLSPGETRATGPNSSIVVRHPTEESLYTRFVLNEQIKGEMVLGTLAESLGEQGVNRLLREFAAQYRHKTATTADFIRMAEAAVGRDLSATFRGAKIDPARRIPYATPYPLGTAPGPSR